MYIFYTMEFGINNSFVSQSTKGALAYLFLRNIVPFQKILILSFVWYLHFHWAWHNLFIMMKNDIISSKNTTSAISQQIPKFAPCAMSQGGPLSSTAFPCSGLCRQRVCEKLVEDRFASSYLVLIHGVVYYYEAMS